MSARLALDVNGAEVVISVDVRPAPSSPAPPVERGLSVQARRPKPGPWDPKEAAARVRLWLLAEASRCPRSRLRELVRIAYDIVGGLEASYQDTPRAVKPAALESTNTKED